MRYGLRFISGKYQGGEYPLPDEGELLVGRASELDLVLAEDMVSRKHAKMALQGSVFSITDLGSTNGTFVNGEKIKRADLKRGDRILIGTSILKVVDQTELAIHDPDSAHAKSRMQELGARPQTTSTMSGDLSDVPLPDLLQLFATNKKGGALALAGELHGCIYIKQGQVQFATITEDTDLKPFKAFCRMVAWDHGTFQLDAYDETTTFAETFKESTESLLIEALRQCDEMRRLLPMLPPPETRFRLKVPLAPKLSSLKSAEIETLQLAINGACLKDAIEQSPGTDHEAMQAVHKLLKEGFLVAG